MLRGTASTRWRDFVDIAQTRWAAWRRRHALHNTPEDFAELLTFVIAFAEPILEPRDDLTRSAPSIRRNVVPLACPKQRGTAGNRRSSGDHVRAPDQWFRVFLLVSGLGRCSFGSRGSGVQISPSRPLSLAGTHSPRFLLGGPGSPARGDEAFEPP